jgi:hypothetical protein
VVPLFYYVEKWREDANIVAHTVFQTANTCLNISISAHALLPPTYHLMPIVEYMLLECPIRAPHPQMGRSDWSLLTTSVSQLTSSDMYVAIGKVQEYSACWRLHSHILTNRAMCLC